MSGGRWSRNRSHIGVDVGSTCVRVIQLDRRGGTLRVCAAEQRNLPESDPTGDDSFHDAVAEALTDLLQQGDFTGKRIVTALPTRIVHCKNLRLPRMPAGELAEAVRWDAADRLSSLGETMATQFLDAGEVRQGEEVRHEIILLAASERFIDRHVDSLSGKGLNLEAVEVAPTALARTIDRRHSQRPHHYEVIIELGATGTRVLITQLGRVRFFKNIDLGARAIDTAIAHRLHVDMQEASRLRRLVDQLAQAGDAPLDDTIRVGERTLDDQSLRRDIEYAIRAPLEELAREIALCLRYFSVTFRNPRPQTAHLLGALATNATYLKTLEHEAGLHAEAIDPFEQAGVDPTPCAARLDGSRYHWSAALGLALRTGRATAERRAA